MTIYWFDTLLEWHKTNFRQLRSLSCLFRMLLKDSAPTRADNSKLSYTSLNYLYTEMPTRSYRTEIYFYMMNLKLSKIKSSDSKIVFQDRISLTGGYYYYYSEYFYNHNLHPICTSLSCRCLQIWELSPPGHPHPLGLSDNVAVREGAAPIVANYTICTIIV